MTKDAHLDTKELIVMEHLYLAKELLKSGLHDDVNLVYELALSRAEELYGTKSALVGQVLLDQIDFYDHVNARDQKENVWRRLREIAIHYFGTDLKFSGPNLN